MEEFDATTITIDESDPIQPTAMPPWPPLKVLRKQLKMSQKELAFAVRCAPCIICDTEKFGYRPTLELQERVAAYLKVDRRVIWPEVEESHNLP